MAKNEFIKFRVDGVVVDTVDKAAETLGGVSRSEAARFLMYLGIKILDSTHEDLTWAKTIWKTYEEFLEEKEKGKD